jgi:hypothetical protein
VPFAPIVSAARAKDDVIKTAERDVSWSEQFFNAAFLWYFAN